MPGFQGRATYDFISHTNNIHNYTNSYFQPPVSKNASTVSLLRGIRAKNGSGQSNNAVGLSQSLKTSSKKPFVRPFEDDYGNNEASINTEFKENGNEKSNLITNEMVDTNVTTIERSCKEEKSELLNINNNVNVNETFEGKYYVHKSA